jgi:hypothetical protein
VVSTLQLWYIRVFIEDRQFSGLTQRFAEWHSSLSLGLGMSIRQGLVPTKAR